MKTIMIGNKEIGEGKGVFIIAEAGINHDGKLSQAKELVKVAAEAGADAVKFQLFRAEDLLPSNCGSLDTPGGKIDIFKFFKELEMPAGWLSELADYSRRHGLIFLCSIFNPESIPQLEMIKVPAYKIASPELNHIPLLRAVARLGKPIIISTGLSRIGDIEEAVEVCRAEKNEQIILLHCITAYPAPQEECNLNVIRTMKLAFEVPVGFSDHTLHPTLAPRIAVALGAAVIEKHFTVNKKLDGPDHAISLDPQELKEMVRAIRKLEKIDPVDRIGEVKKQVSPELIKKICGRSKKTITESEQGIYPCNRRSIHAVVDLEKGDRLNETTIKVLRSERNLRPGLHPRFYGLVLGKKLKRAVARGQGIVWEDLLGG